jgi:transcriptional regulator with XRE-family HTH domain
MVSSMGISDPIDVVVRELAIRFGRELRLAAMGLPQREIARRAGISQAYLSRIMRGLAMPDLALMTRLSHAAGHRFWFKLFPTTGDTFAILVSSTLQRSSAPPLRRYGGFDLRLLWQVRPICGPRTWSSMGSMKLTSSRSSEACSISKRNFAPRSANALPWQCSLADR